MFNKVIILAILLEIGSVIPYIRDMLKGRSKPNIVSWGAWALLAAIEAGTLFAQGARASGALALTSAIALSVVVVLGIRYGFSKFGTFDVVCLIGAIMAGLVWAVSQSAKLGLYTSIFIDCIVTIPTVYHAWHRYREETLSTYLISATSGVLVLATLSRFMLVDSIYPLLHIFANGTIAIAIIHGRVKYTRTRHKAAIKAAHTRKRNRLKLRPAYISSRPKLKTVR